MGRGRRQFYDPIMQAPGMTGEPQDLSRIEFFPDADGRWLGRKVGETGLIEAVSPGSFNRDGALAEVEGLWPGLTVYELREEAQDSTWEGVGPSPRLWHQPATVELPDQETLKEWAQEYQPLEAEMIPSYAPRGEPTQVRGVIVEFPGQYLLREDVVALLREYADQFDAASNPSGALALREAAEALSE